MTIRKRGLIVFASAFAFYAIAFADKDVKTDEDVNEEKSLLFDEHTPRFDAFSFDIDESKRLKPKANDFKLLQFAPMSNKIGERWVLITVRNTSTGRRFLRSEYVVATFADGKQSHPIDLEESVDAEETFTKTIFFGVSKFPIVLLATQP